MTKSIKSTKSSKSIKLSDEELILLMRKSGEKEAAEYTSALISRYIRVIIMKANRKGAQSTDKEDLISEGFIGLLHAIRAFNDSKGSFSTFANTCVSNRMKTHIMASARLPKVAEGFDIDALEDCAPNADELLISREADDEFLMNVKERLSDFEYNVLTLYMNGYSYRQIAEKYGVGVKSVDNALSRARGKLKNLRK